MKSAVRVSDLRKDYVLGGETVHALRGVSFDVPVGDYISIMGPSGSGKSTLLNLLGCLDRPTAGQFMLSDVDVSRMSDDQLAEIRATRIGFIFQSYNLLSALSVVENIEVPLYYSNRISSATRRRCRELAESHRQSRFGDDRRNPRIARATQRRRTHDYHGDPRARRGRPDQTLDRAQGRVSRVRPAASDRRGASGYLQVGIGHVQRLAANAAIEC
jgi:ABC-type lipoprotein export system ATPase subunit